MLKYKILTCTIISIILSGTISLAQKKCMFIGAAAGAENAEYDKYIIPKLEAWGYVVDKHNAVDLPKYKESDYAPYDFIFLSESTNSADMAPLQEIQKPMLNSDGWGAKFSSLAFCSADQVGILEPAQPIVFLESAKGNPLAAGYAPGTVTELGTVLVRKDPCLIVWAKPTISVIPIAGVASDPSQLIVYGVEKGTKNALGMKIKNRVSVIGLHAWGYKYLTEDGASILKAGIKWILE